MCTETDKSRGTRAEPENSYESNAKLPLAVRGNANAATYTYFITSVFIGECSMRIISLCDTMQYSTLLLLDCIYLPCTAARREIV